MDNLNIANLHLADPKALPIINHGITTSSGFIVGGERADYFKFIPQEEIIVTKTSTAEIGVQTDFPDEVLCTYPNLNLFFCTFHGNAEVATYCDLGHVEKTELNLEENAENEDAEIVGMDDQIWNYSSDEEQESYKVTERRKTRYGRTVNTVQKIKHEVNEEEEEEEESSDYECKPRNKIVLKIGKTEGSQIKKEKDQMKTKRKTKLKGKVSKNINRRKIRSKFGTGKIPRKRVKKFRCTDCEAVYPSIRELHKHILQNHNPDNIKFNCNMCSSTFTLAYNLQRHKNTIHRQEEKIGCEYCGKTFGRRDRYNYHVQNAHKDNIDGEIKPTLNTPAYKCDGCQKFFSRRRNFLEHTDADLKCESCKLPFSCKTSLRLHYNKCGSQLPCDQCEKVCKDRSALHLHKLTHNPKYKCDKCPRSFVWNSQLKAHLTFHTGERPYICDLCNHTFTHSNALKTHKNQVHFGNKAKFGCSLCEKSFPCKAKLDCHMRMHTGEKPFVCNLCGSAYSQACNLKAHVQSIHGVYVQSMKPDGTTETQLVKYKRPTKKPTPQIHQQPPPPPHPVPMAIPSVGIASSGPPSNTIQTVPQNYSNTVIMSAHCNDRVVGHPETLNKIEYTHAIPHNQAFMHPAYEIAYTNIL